MAVSKYGMILTLGGAPNTPHFLLHPDTGRQIPGEYRPDEPTEVPFSGMSLKQAQDLDKDERIPLTLVEITEPKGGTDG